MSLNKKIIYILIFFITFLLILNIESYAGYQNWNSLNYDVTVNSDGSMNVVETWNIDISETNTLFKDFVIDKSKYSEISDVMVSRVEDSETPLTQIYEEQYHVDSGCYYALPIKGNKFEIAWNVGLDDSSSTRIYKIYYTIEDAVKIYNDCTELYWMFLGKDNEIPGENITGTIRLPQSVSNIEKLKIWAHGPLTGNIEKISENTISFSVPSLKSNTMIEVRVVTEENIYNDCTNLYIQDELENILEEEQEWANKANMQRKLYKFSYVIAFIIFVVTLLIFYKILRKHKREGKECIQRNQFDIPQIQYFREIPNEKNATPSRVVLLRNIKLSMSNIIYDTSKVFSATILDLAVKGFVEFAPVDNKTFNIIVKNGNYELPQDEKYVYDLLLNIARKTEGSPSVINSKELTRYAKRNYDEFYNLGNKIKESSKKYQVGSGNIDSKKISEAMKWENLLTIYIFVVTLGVFLGIFSIPMIATASLQIGLILGALGIGTFLGSIINLITVCKIRSKLSILSSSGYEEKIEWDALEKYMKDYSLLKEREVFDVVLWEKFLVYATAFGISKKVLEQLKIVYPEAFVADNNYSSHYGYWYFISNDYFGENGFSSLDNAFRGAFESAESAYSAAHSDYSSGSGGGGGFSSGGGGRRRRRRLRRSLKKSVVASVKFRDVPQISSLQK